MRPCGLMSACAADQESAPTKPRVQIISKPCTLKTVSRHPGIDKLPGTPPAGIYSLRKGFPMYILTEYLDQAMAQAVYEKLDDGKYGGRIPTCPGVVAFAASLGECSEDLRSTLEDWVLLGMKLVHPLPAVCGIDLNREPRLHPGSRFRRSSGRNQTFLHDTGITGSASHPTPNTP